MKKMRLKDNLQQLLDEVALDQASLFETRGLVTCRMGVIGEPVLESIKNEDGTESVVRWVDVVASTADIDSHGEIVEQDWDLTRYLSNPVILWNHNSLCQQDTLPIGRGVNTRVDDGKLRTRIVFASEDANPMGRRVFKLFQEKILNAVSVGFKPGEIKREERGPNGEKIPVLRKNVLYEISATPVPANANALAEAISRAADTAALRTNSAMHSASPQEKDEMKTIEELERSLEDEREKTKTLTERLGVLENELSASRKRVNELESKAVEAELGALVGKKITRVEIPVLVKLAVKDRTLYEEQLKAINERPDMMLTEQVIDHATEKTAPQLPAPSTNNESRGGTAFAAIVGKA